MKKIGILGGTFDPVHNGHIYLAQTALEDCKLDEIVFLPLNVPPHKKAPHADTATRYNLIARCIKDTPKFTLSDMEIKRVGTTYTVDTLRDIKSLHPNWDISYIIGTDTLYELEKWRNIGEVFYLCSFICMTRPGEDFDGQEQYARRLADKYHGNITVIATMGKDVSSTLIRNASADELKSLVPPEIYDDVKKIYAKEEVS